MEPYNGATAARCISRVRRAAVPPRVARALPGDLALCQGRAYIETAQLPCQHRQILRGQLRSQTDEQTGWVVERHVRSLRFEAEAAQGSSLLNQPTRPHAPVLAGLTDRQCGAYRMHVHV